MIPVFDARPALISTRLMFGVAVGTTLLGAIAAASLCGRRFGRTTRTEEPSTDPPDQLPEVDHSTAALHDDWPDSDALIVIVEDDDIFLDEDEGIFVEEDDRHP